MGFGGVLEHQNVVILEFLGVFPKGVLAHQRDIGLKYSGVRLEKLLGGFM